MWVLKNCSPPSALIQWVEIPSSEPSPISMNRNGSAAECAIEFTPFSLFGPSFFHVLPVSVLRTAG